MGNPSHEAMPKRRLVPSRACLLGDHKTPWAILVTQHLGWICKRSGLGFLVSHTQTRQIRPIAGNKKP